MNSDALKKRRVLGKGLASLIPEANTAPNIVLDNKDEDLGSRAQYFQCKIEEVHPSELQPRKDFDSIDELSESIKEHGILQPLIVRKSDRGYELVAGERRWRAAKQVGIETVPVIVKDFTDKKSLTLAIVENIQRSDLNIIEEALAYKQLIDDYGMTQDLVAKNVGKDRSSVTNALRLLRLPGKVKQAIIDDVLSMGHARALCSLEHVDQILSVADVVIEEKLSVRDTEKLIKKVNKGRVTIVGRIVQET
jgi:ParB family chromosome partitioning protein